MPGAVQSARRRRGAIAGVLPGGPPGQPRFPERGSRVPGCYGPPPVPTRSVPADRAPAGAAAGSRAAAQAAVAPAADPRPAPGLMSRLTGQNVVATFSDLVRAN